ncbi:diacylglycerol kinase family protein [Salinisphaera sp. SPP-AMP-43]|uniref:diacylglycerol kinase family protein n=1 Tax=Salinisphaera sp. SPP-AMP-43 TaxID=3121288 RepID=UPI003C6E7328
MDPSQARSPKAAPEHSPAAVSISASQRLGLIYNTQSGRHRRRWGRHPLPEHVPAVEANTPDEIERAVIELAAQNVEVLAVAGGDGTVQCVLGHLLLARHFGRPPIVALVPTGSTNMTANDVGFVDVRRRGWQPLCAWAEQAGNDPAALIVEREVLRIQASDSQPPFCGMFFGAGAIHHAVQYTQQHLHGMGLRGETGPSLTFARFLKSIVTGDRRQFSSIRLRLRDDHGHATDDQTLLLAASTLNRLVLRFHPFWGRETAPIAWTAISQNAPRFGLRWPLVARGWGRYLPNQPSAGYISHNSHTLSLDFDDGFIVDGEFYRSCPEDGPVRLSIAGAVRFLSL